MGDKFLLSSSYERVWTDCGSPASWGRLKAQSRAPTKDTEPLDSLGVLLAAAASEGSKNYMYSRFWQLFNSRGGGGGGFGSRMMRRWWLECEFQVSNGFIMISQRYKHTRLWRRRRKRRRRRSEAPLNLGIKKYHMYYVHSERNGLGGHSFPWNAIS